MILIKKRGRPAGSKNKPKVDIKPKTIIDYTFDEHQQALLKTFQQAKEAERLAEENNRWQNKYALLNEQYEALQRKYDGDTRSKKEYELLVKQGQMKPPLTS